MLKDNVDIYSLRHFPIKAAFILPNRLYTSGPVLHVHVDVALSLSV